MRKSPGLVLGALVAIACATPNAIACGDKLTVMGGGVRFERLKESRFPSTIFMVVPPSSPLAGTSEDVRLVSALELAGHKVRIVRDEGEIDIAARETAPDLVLVDPSAAQKVSTRIAGLSSAPPMLAVVPAGQQASATAASCVATVDRRGRRVLMTIESMLEKRSRGLPPDCDPAPKRRST